MDFIKWIVFGVLGFFADYSLWLTLFYKVE